MITIMHIRLLYMQCVCCVCNVLHVCPNNLFFFGRRSLFYFFRARLCIASVRLPPEVQMNINKLLLFFLLYLYTYIFSFLAFSLSIFHERILHHTFCYTAESSTCICIHRSQFETFFFLKKERK